MKKTSFIIIICLSFFYGCKEEMVGQYPVDSVPPQPVSDVVVNNLPGKVVVKYQLPNEPDLLYVKAVYTDALGQHQEVKASVFRNELEIPGFGRKTKRTISLVSVDRSRNESGPVYVEIEPEDSPIYAAAAEMEIRPSWSGLVLEWENPSGDQFIVRVLKQNENETFSEIETFYSSEKSVQRSVRGQAIELSTFGVVIEDVYGNSSDTTKISLTPYYEEELPSNTFTALPLAPGYTFRKSGNISYLFDGLHGNGSKLLYIAAGGAPQPYFSIDLGREYLLSRIKVWPRKNANYQYSLHSPHIFEIWGTTDEQAATADPANWEGWVKLGYFEIIRPSGLSPDVAPTTEDIEFANAGFEFEFPLDVTPIRYFRFLSVENWGKSTGLHMDELQLFGRAEE